MDRVRRPNLDRRGMLQELRNLKAPNPYRDVAAVTVADATRRRFGHEAAAEAIGFCASPRLQALWQAWEDRHRAPEEPAG